MRFKAKQRESVSPQESLTASQRTELSREKEEKLSRPMGRSEVSEKIDPVPQRLFEVTSLTSSLPCSVPLKAS